jgi:hypothetical protein
MDSLLFFYVYILVAVGASCAFKGGFPGFALMMVFWPFGLGHMIGSSFWAKRKAKT